MTPGQTPNEVAMVNAGHGTSASAGTKAESEASPKEPSRMVIPHTTRIKVTRGLVHYLGKVFGWQVRGENASNEITTAKYTVLTFLPVNLFEQFLRVANAYFLVMAILQLIPGLSPTSWFTTVAPLVFVLAVNAIKEGYDDVRRHRSDNEVNSRKVLVLWDNHREGEEVEWRDIQVGDLVKVRADEEFPADLVFLASSDPEHLCYVETANLDGETNLKIKYCYPKTSKAVEENLFEEMEGFVKSCNSIRCEEPNNKLYQFDGYVDVKNERKEALDAANLLLRGSTLRKTHWVVGVAVFTGVDSKIMQNMVKAPRKVTQIERHMNILVLVMCALLLVVSVALAIADMFWSRKHRSIIKDAWYLLKTGNEWPDLDPGIGSIGVQTLRFIILFSNLIPISLYVTLEVVKVFQCALLLNNDLEMYYEPTDTPFVCRSTALNEELGQVQYVLSDKTGTLTQNIMGFVLASIHGVLYGRNTSWCKDIPRDTPHSLALDEDLHKILGTATPDKPQDDRMVEDFFLNLAICNTVVPSRDETGKITYQASSPDEEALVQGAAYLGYALESRSTDQVVISHKGTRIVYDVLAILEFNSDRKRMSIICRREDTEDEYQLFCKGADSVILARLAPEQGLQGLASGEQAMNIEELTRRHLDEMAQEGFRTLCLAEKTLSREEYENWSNEFHAASVALDNREGRIAEVSEKIETNLTLLGATAVEDKLQDGVPECIASLAKAGIKVWVLTGDKVETAISISHSCKLFTEDMDLVLVRETDFMPNLRLSLRRMPASAIEELRQVLREKIEEVQDKNNRMGMKTGNSNVGLVVDGGALAVCLHKLLQGDFMQLCKSCKAVVCCRVSPLQKSEVTKMVKKRAGAITLGIGDGANDVGMIREAHIGVGISGREGRAAVLSSDFSFAQFKYLSRLLLLHGRWAYLRNREVVHYSFYKNWAYTLLFFYPQFYAGFSAVPIFSTMLISTFNLLWAAFPIVAYSVLEQDVDQKVVLRNEELYKDSMLETRRSFFLRMGAYLGLSTLQSLAIFFLPWYVLANPNSGPHSDDLTTVGTAIFFSLVVVVNLFLALRTHYWTWINHLLTWGVSIGLLFAFIYGISVVWELFSISALADMAGVAVRLYGSSCFWLAAIIWAPGTCMAIDLAALGFKRAFRKKLYEKLQEAEAFKPDMEAGHRSSGSLLGATGHGGGVGAPWLEVRGRMSAGTSSPLPTLPVAESTTKLPDIRDPVTSRV